MCVGVPLFWAKSLWLTVVSYLYVVYDVIVWCVDCLKLVGLVVLCGNKVGRMFAGCIFSV